MNRFLRNHGVPIFSVVLVLALVVYLYFTFRDFFSDDFQNRLAMVCGQANGFIADLEAGHCDAAYGRMSTSYRDGVDVERFCATVNSHPTLSTARRLEVIETSDLYGTVRVTGRLQTDGESVMAEFFVLLTEDECQITGLVLNGVWAVPAPASSKP